MRTPNHAILLGFLALLAARLVAAPAKVDLVQIGTVGDLPPATQTLVIELNADGAIFIHDKESTYAAMRKELGIFARREDEPHVVIRADRTLPWFAVQWVMGACAEEGIYRVFHAARSEEKGAGDGALALYLPGFGKGIGPTAQEAEPQVSPCFELRVVSGEATTTREAVHASLSRSLKRLAAEERDRAYVEFYAAPETPTGHCLLLLDAVFRSGARRVNVYSWDEAGPTTKSMTRRVADLRARREARKDQQGFGVTIDREAVPALAAPATLEPVKRLHGRFAGFFPKGGSGFSGLMDVSPEEEPEAEPED